MIAGSEEAKKQPRLEENEINALANKIFDSMMQRGYAHIQPREDFIRGFKQGFEYAQMGHQI